MISEADVRAQDAIAPCDVGEAHVILVLALRGWQLQRSPEADLLWNGFVDERIERCDANRLEHGVAFVGRRTDVARQECIRGVERVHAQRTRSSYCALSSSAAIAWASETRSLIIHPASTTHRQLSDEDRIKAGAGPDVVRLSVGIEDPDDIIADLEQAMA